MKEISTSLDRPRTSGPPAPLRSHWPDNPEKPSHTPHWSADETLVRSHRAAFRSANRDLRNAKVMAHLLGCTLEDLRNL